jgi:hypothetical protein
MYDDKAPQRANHIFLDSNSNHRNLFDDIKAFLLYEFTHFMDTLIILFNLYTGEQALISM